MMELSSLLQGVVQLLKRLLEGARATNELLQLLKELSRMLQRPTLTLRQQQKLLQETVEAAKQHLELTDRVMHGLLEVTAIVKPLISAIQEVAETQGRVSEDQRGQA